ncbi:hypothetical protein [Chryseobacterium oryctis]|uniref:Lipocalin-like domain-containing protein n=1 Tax=Chryseobacterium oryctis TaxID=2952618 RepID=A0ABT3HQ36_9FLAO|nr:hypothetical protein [Chryseobacterium oryctis]MCW3161869.1 hypothetical protein [Chryseobacterium oryctis]
MKLLNLLAIVCFSLAFSQSKTTQKQAEKPLDNPTKCSNIKEGTFLRINYPKNLWYMTVKDNVQTEFYNDGKDFIKSTMVFVDDCTYKSIVLDVQGKDIRIKVDDVFTNKIVATQDNYIKIQSQISGDKYNFVLVKVKENQK